MEQPSLERVVALTQIGQPHEARVMLENLIDRNIGFYNEENHRQFVMLRDRPTGITDAQVMERQDMENDVGIVEDDLQALLARFDQGITLAELQPIYNEMAAVVRGHRERFPQIERENQELRRQAFHIMLDTFDNPTQEGGLDVEPAD